MASRWLWALGWSVWVWSGLAYAGEVAFVHKSSDGFSLAGKLAYPTGTTDANAARVVILIHGSGPQGMDSDLSAASAGKPNCFFCDIRDGLVKKQFVVLRYNKRSFEINQLAAKDKNYVKGPAFKAFMENSLKYFVDDARGLVQWAQKKMPKAKIYLAGFSQGTYIALQVAEQEKAVAGVAVTGFYASTLETISHEQIIHRPLYWFRSVDKNNDGLLDPSELMQAGAVGLSLAAQGPALDADGDGKISFMEIQGGNYINMLKFQRMLRANTLQELRYPRVDQILERLKIPVIFFQGMWDNQTLAYHALSIRILAQYIWKKNNFRFFFFPKLGHILDKRDRFDDLVYRRIEASALEKLGSEMAALFK